MYWFGGCACVHTPVDNVYFSSFVCHAVLAQASVANPFAGGDARKGLPAACPEERFQRRLSQSHTESADAVLVPSAGGKPHYNIVLYYVFVCFCLGLWCLGYMSVAVEGHVWASSSVAHSCATNIASNCGTW